MVLRLVPFSPGWSGESNLLGLRISLLTDLRLHRLKKKSFILKRRKRKKFKGKGH